jgi:DNA-binding beta-propeller fold protein YncE
MKCSPFVFAAIAGITALPVTEVHARESGYKVVARYQPGGEGGWDALSVDPEAHRLYVSRSTRVQVIDLETGKLVGEIPDTPGVHGIALAPELGQGFTSNGRDSSVTAFDLKTLAPRRKIRIDARNADAILYDATVKRVFSFNGGSSDVTAIDAVADTVVGNLALGGRPEFAVSDDKGHVFVNLEDSSAVVRFDARTLTIDGRWPLAPGEEPTGLAIDRAHGRLFSACHNQRMVVLDAGSGRVVATVPIGTGVDGADFDPQRGLAFSPNGEGTVTVIREETPNSYSVVDTVTTQRGARTIALDAKTHRLYLPTASFGEAPAPTAENPRPRPPMVPGSFVILVLER